MLSSSFLALGRIDEAEQASKEIDKLNPDSAGAHMNRYFFAFLRRDQAAMDREISRSRQTRGSGFHHCARQHCGILWKAKAVGRSCEACGGDVETQKRPENAAKEWLGLAATQMVIGKCQQAKEYTKAATALYSGRNGLSGAALIYSGCGDESQAQAIVNQLRTTYPSDTLIQSILTPTVQAAIEGKRGNLDEAVRLMRIRFELMIAGS